MTAAITRLPTAATSYYTVRKSGRNWAVELVTPAPGRPLRTKLRSYSDPAAANADAAETAKRMARPFKIGGRAA
ncbi:hypothetical protein EN852_009770 [Mesorhizobium sp. M2E.F.Ca.ET.209.01.1.1]|uniref:hypothetical protein n=1 Tax=Mesorhizobium sp. M2E.F.Ca.ET.209.01.1.1 TaxID=2500526 RepID=UPI000FDC7522|nr:hypothetical protein [Mesorhizobium sp. M2E.F.Ca.ET.209.01.1.1]TGS15911.1 hypothetical protein EN852_009770 [Mesorhizobium sp. M2E.F.Ca.ET.209.01.1.1]